MKVLKGKLVAEHIYSLCHQMNGEKLIIITIGDDDASKVYIRNKIKACERVGLVGVNIKYDVKDYVDYTTLANTIQYDISMFNKDKNVVGIMIQQPYPIELRKYHLEDCIDEYKDVDGLHYNNMSNTLLGETPNYYPATPLGIIFLLDYYNIPIEGKDVTIIGRSNIVGKPLAAMMDKRNATVTLCHSKTKNLNCHVLSSDITITAINKPKFINNLWINNVIKPTIIDVGINRDENNKLCGNVDFEDVLSEEGNITPVPGGVGIVTLAALMYNCTTMYLQNNVY